MPSLLETTLNTRYIGGMHTMFLRSDVIKAPSVRDTAWLLAQQVTTIIDLRTEAEAAAAPEALTAGFHCLHCPIKEGSGVPSSPEAVPDSYMVIAQATRMPQVFRAMAQAPAGVLFHCSAGKDRTGVAAAVLLMLAGADDRAIVADYMLTKAFNAPRFALLQEKMPELMPIVLPRPAYMEGFLARFRAAFGTAEAYLRRLGLTDGEIAALQTKLQAGKKD